MNVIFVCWGNICRSPMAERVARGWAARRGVDATFTSAGVSSEETGNPIDPRAVDVLTKAGYDASGHRAHRITAEEIERADLVIAAEPMHIQRLFQLAPNAENLRLLNDYNPTMKPGKPLPDPWYGGPKDFDKTLKAVEAAMPGIFEEMAFLDGAWG